MENERGTTKQFLSPIYQSNEISASVFLQQKKKHVFEPLSLYQNKIFATVMYELNGLREMTLYKKKELPKNIDYDPEDSTFVVSIDMSKIVKPMSYEALYTAIIELQSGFKIILPSKFGKNREELSMIILAVEREQKGKYYQSAIVRLKIAKKAALALTNIKTVNDRPIEFTKWYYETALNATCKYTQKFYFMLSAWKNTGYLKISLEKLKEELGILPHEFLNFAVFKREVLKRIEKDLRNSHCSIDLENDTAYLKKYGNKKITDIHFKINTIKEKGITNIFAQQLLFILKKEFKLKENHYESLYPVLDVMNSNDFEEALSLLSKIKRLENNNGINESVAAYTVESIRNLFKNEIKII